MQIVIDIPDTVWNKAMEYGHLDICGIELSEKVMNGTPLPKGCNIQRIIPEKATNGDMIKAIFDIPDSEIDEGFSTTYIYTRTRILKGCSQNLLREQITFNKDWWNAPYKVER